MPLAKLHAFPAQVVALSQFAKALSHPARIAIITFLHKRGECPCMEIVDSLPLSQPACSRHVNALRKVGLLRAKIRGSVILYSLDHTKIQRFCDAFGTTLNPAKKAAR